jgi:predicted AlkP superfamily phosphohydrolase/phosphomutase
MRVFLFGVDGLTFRVLHPFMERGLLPNFQRVQDQGVEAILKSSPLPMTPPAWTSISTGLSPAKHGVYDFWDYHQTGKSALTKLVTHRKGGKAIWNTLSEWGKNVIVANVPVTYPPEPVNGIMLSGHTTPSVKTNWVYPSELKEELLQAVPDYQIDLTPAVINGQIGDPFAETLQMTQQRIKMLRLLLNKPWDFFFIVFTGPDRIQHLRWDEIMGLHPQAVEYYQMLDQALGIVLDQIKSEDMLMIVSDHGFQGAHRKFYAQEYLYQQKLLHLSNNKDRMRAELTNRIREVVWSMGLRNVPTMIRSRLRHAGILPVTTKHHVIPTLDLEATHTHAWIPTHSGVIAGYTDIFFDDVLTEEDIESLKVAFQQIRDPETDQPLVAAMYREDAFGTGPFAPKERHLIILSGEDTTILTDLGSRNLWGDWNKSSGIHHPDGVLYFYGAGVKSGQIIAPAHIYDIVPTILTRLGYPLSKDLDGKVIEEAFEVVSTPASDNGNQSTVKNKLRNLTL